MEKADKVAYEYAKEHGTLGLDYNQIYDAAKYAYKQAEEDIALTWEDVRELCALSFVVEVDLGREISDKQHYREVLRRFNEYKEGKK